VRAHLRVDWLTPAGLRSWGDGRTLVLGTRGYLELRKYLDLARSAETDHLLLADARGEHELHLRGRVGFPFFGAFILDCLARTERAMSQEHVFTAAALALHAQALADASAPRA
jgi:hypothetical protein